MLCGIVLNDPTGSSWAAETKLSVSVASIPFAQIQRASRRVDELVEAGYAKHRIQPNSPATDEVFLRRIYLNVIGRIPSHGEAQEFLSSKQADKRARLIDTLLDSEGYVSHQFNYFADLLRIQSRMRYAPAQPYIEFVKQSVRDNKPFDVFVRELITAEGYTWDNGAAGYYLRDTGMPLDHMSNTAQVFLGTQLVCAQCHNHPYDSWTQREYFELAAFSYGVETRDRRSPKSMELSRMRRSGDVDREVLRAAGQILQPLAYRAHETDRRLTLPHDYQYDDAKPKSPVQPSTIFGDDVKVPAGASRKEIYANWMTSPKNPRFTTVIANRLWKRALGVGLIEPVDDFKDGIEPSNPALMKYLVGQLTDLKYDVKQYFRIIYNTKTYQRQVSDAELEDGESYHFPGPVLVRMTAEQLWDSLLTLVIQDVDERKGLTRDYGRYANGAELVDKDMKEILAMAEQSSKVRVRQMEFYQQSQDLQKQLRVATRTNDRVAVAKFRKEVNDLRAKVLGPEGMAMMAKQREQARQSARDTDPRWARFSRDLVRASETESPARPGHFLRQFGQSDRETIENANTEANVPQILTLLNGPIFSQLLHSSSMLTKNLNSAEEPGEKLDVVFISILGRRPTERERELTRAEIENGPRGIADVVWALLNTRQFMFVQ